MNTPDEIEHNGKTLERLQKINDATQGDLVAFEGGRFLPVINNEDGYPSVNLGVVVLPISDIITIQAAYREKKADAKQLAEYMQTLIDLGETDIEYILEELLRVFGRDEKKEEVRKWVPEWVPEAAKLAMNCRELNDVWERTNEYLTATYGSPEALMRKGAEQAIQLTEDEWDQIEEDLSHPNLFPHYKRLLPQLLANRPKGGEK